MPVLSDWIDAVGSGRAVEGTEESQRELDPRFLLPGPTKLTSLAMLHRLIGTITLYLDSPQRWHDLAQRGLHPLLLHLITSMWTAAEQSLHQSMGHQQSTMNVYGVAWFFDFLSSASKIRSTHPLAPS